MERKLPPPSERMTDRARQLRHQLTTPERLLWSKLRNGRCAGLRFRRQQPIGPYVTDFLCASVRVIVELDGRSHDEQEVSDQQRQAYLEQQGWLVVRVSNDRVISDLEGVAQAIADICESRVERPGQRPSPGPSGHPLP